MVRKIFRQAVKKQEVINFIIQGGFKTLLNIFNKGKDRAKDYKRSIYR